jgi:hypothetical protein
MARLPFALGILALTATACASEPVSYGVTAIAPIVSTDSLETLSEVRARSLGFTVYESNAALQRLQDLQIGVDLRSDFMFVDRRASCGSWLTHSPFCKQVDFLIVTFPVVDGERVVWVSAGTDRHANPFSDWELQKASVQIRAAADSLAAGFGTVRVLTAH